MNRITTSVFDLFKVGLGPSSSHTIGPMTAARRFLERAAEAGTKISNGSVEVELFGSLASTGHGHGSDRAVAAGFLGLSPAECDPDAVAALLTDAGREYRAAWPGKGGIVFDAKSIQFRTGTHEDFPFSNAMRFTLRDRNRRILRQELCYSIGGGFVQFDGDCEPPPPSLPWRYRDFESFRLLTEKYHKSPAELLLENEFVLHSSDVAEIRARLSLIIAVMEDAVERGLHTAGVLPGALRLQRRAGRIFERAAEPGAERSLLLLDAFAIAAAEENAAGHRVVTAPTSGSSGVLPSVIRFLRTERGATLETLSDSMLIAALIGMIARHNASISGAEVGCQGEIGVASAMAAALLAAFHGADIERIGCAAEIALEHHLGLSCDPVDGYVQIPCIERNAAGAVAAWNAWLMASCIEPGQQRVRFDEVLAAMMQTGRKMDPDFKETARGGLAVCALCC